MHGAHRHTWRFGYGLMQIHEDSRSYGLYKTMIQRLAVQEAESARLAAEARAAAALGETVQDTAFPCTPAAKD